METPAGIVYSTPFAMTFSPKMSKAPPSKCNPTAVASADAPRHNDNLYLVWNGHTKADFEAMHKQAHELDRSGKVEDAEAKFREALEGFEHVLSPTHDETNTVAYHLAEFLANQARMTEADTVLNWMGEKHFEEGGMSHKKTTAHLLHVSDMYHSWSRSEDAISLLSRAMARCEKSLKSTLESDNGEDSDASTVVEPTRNASSRNLRPRRSSTIIEPDDDNPDDPQYVEYQLGLAIAQVKAHDETANLLLQNLIDKCEEHPKELAVQILNVRATLVEHYQGLGESEKTEKALQEAASSFWKVLKLDFKKTPSILEAAGRLAELHVKAGHLDTGEKMFLKVESEAVESFGEDDDSTIDVLTAIGVFYQEQERWDDAGPRFEQALSASMTAYGLESEVTARLETALEKRSYVLHFPNCEDFEAKLRKRWTCRRVHRSPDSRRRRFLIDP
jgi:tetratricopeptide (TPR) repeat protein